LIVQWPGKQKTKTVFVYIGSIQNGFGIIPPGSHDVIVLRQYVGLGESGKMWTKDQAEEP